MDPSGERRPRSAGSCAGFTLFELLILVAIVALIAAAAIPAMAPTHGPTLDAAAAELVDALRFARHEAQRTGVHHGVRIDAGAGATRVRVFRYDTGATPPAEDYTVQHPLDRRPYDVTFAARPALGAAYVQAATFASGATTVAGVVAFDARGAPQLLNGTSTLPLTAGNVTVIVGTLTRTVGVDPETGRPAWL